MESQIQSTEVGPTDHTHRQSKVVPRKNLVISSPKDENKTCRICMEPESEEYILITPCKCKGSMEFIHEECLKAWILSQEKEVTESKCELCFSEFEMEVSIKKVCTPKGGLKEGLSQCLFIPVLFLVLVMLGFIIALLVDEVINGEDTQLSYTIALLSICTIACFVIIYLMARSFKEACFYQKMDNWKIFSVETQDLQDQSPEVDGSFTEKSNYVFVLPQICTVKGKKAITPKIKPNMARIGKSGRSVMYTPKFMTPRISLGQSRLSPQPGYHSELSSFYIPSSLTKDDLFPNEGEITNQTIFN